VKVANIEGDAAKWTWGEAFEPETTTEKFAVKELGDSGNGAGRLRIDLEAIGLMSARAGD